MTSTPKHSETPNLPATHGEFVLHLLFLTMAAIVLLMSFVMDSRGDSQVFLPGIEFPLPSMCSSQVLLGTKCPGCGLTRAFIAISQGQFKRAWNFNSASFFVYAFVAVQIPWHGFQLWRLSQSQPPLETDFVYLAPIALALLLVGNWIVSFIGY